MKKWQETSRKQVYKSWRTMDNVTFKMPDGNRKDFDISISGGGAGTLALTPDNKVIVFEQFRPGPQEMFSEMPGGAIDPNEDPKVAAIRELQEETGYKPGRVEFVASLSRDAYIQGTWHYFVSYDCELVGKPRLDDNEFGEVKLLSIPDFIQALKDGKSTDTGGAMLALHHAGLL